MKDKFKVENYFCNSETLTKKMNEAYNDGYFPKDIQLESYQDKIQGFIIYELEEESECTSKIGYVEGNLKR